MFVLFLSLYLYVGVIFSIKNFVTEWRKLKYTSPDFAIDFVTLIMASPLLTIAWPFIFPVGYPKSVR